MAVNAPLQETIAIVSMELPITCIKQASAVSNLFFGWKKLFFFQKFSQERPEPVIIRFRQLYCTIDSDCTMRCKTLCVASLLHKSKCSSLVHQSLASIREAFMSKSVLAVLRQRRGKYF